MKTILRNLCLTSFALIGAGQASAVPVFLDTLVHVGDKFSIAELSRGLAGDYFVESSDVNVVKIDNDSVYVTASYYDGNGEYAEKQASLLLYNAATNMPLAGVNVKVAPEARLSEAKTYTNPTDLQMESIEFTRTFKDNSVNTWQTIYLPFAIDIEAHADEFSVARLYGYDFVTDTNKDGIVGKGDNYYIIYKDAESGITRPNEPIMVRPNHAGEITFRAANNLLAAAKNDTIMLADSTFSADKFYEIISSYDVDTLKAGDNNYYIAASGNISRVTKAPTGYYPYRWYIHADSKVGEVFESIAASGVRLTNVKANFETAKPIETVYVCAGCEYDVHKFCYNLNSQSFFSSMESSDTIVAKVAEGSAAGILYITNSNYYYDGNGKYKPLSSKLTLHSIYGNVTIVNIVVNPEAKLTEANFYTNPDTLKMDFIEFTRTFKESSVNTWQTIYLPFAIDIHDYPNLSFARYFGYGPVSDTNGDGVVNNDDKLYIVYKDVTKGITTPNEPLMVRPKQAGDITIRANYDYNSNFKFLYPAERKIIDIKDTTDRTFQIVCTYGGDTLQAGDNNYYIAASGNISRVTKAPTAYPPYRWYIHVDSKVGEVFESISASGVGLVNVDESFEFPKEEVKEETPTSNKNLKSDNRKSVMTIEELKIYMENHKDAELYTMSSVRLKNIDNITKGYYILDGMVIYVKIN